MIIFDTNVISELMKHTRDQRVEKWFARQNPLNCATTVISVAETKAGLAFMPEGKKRRELESSFQKFVPVAFAGRIFPFDQVAAALYGEISAQCKKSGCSSDALDRMIAAIAKSKKATVATRNVKDFKYCDINIINPWSYGLDA